MLMLSAGPNTVVLYGGWSGNHTLLLGWEGQYFNDVYLCNLATQQCMMVAQAAGSMAPVERVSSVGYVHQNSLYVFGWWTSPWFCPFSTHSPCFFSSSHVSLAFAPAGGATWNDSSIPPMQRLAQPVHAKVLNDMWKFDLGSGIWTQLPQTAPWPPPRMTAFGCILGA